VAALTGRQQQQVRTGDRHRYFIRTLCTCVRVITIIPRYNEIESLPLALARLRAAVPASDVLIVDDNSPDGTGDLADRATAEDDQVHVLHRTGKEGLGAACIAGFRWGLERDYDVLVEIVEINADGSHKPEQLQSLLDAVDRADLVTGSRWVGGGGGPGGGGGGPGGTGGGLAWTSPGGRTYRTPPEPPPTESGLRSTRQVLHDLDAALQTRPHPEPEPDSEPPPI